MIVTVTPNPALDLTWSVPRVDHGATHRVAAGSVRAGGKGLNVARVLHGQRIGVLAVSTAGGDTGIEFAAELAASGVPHRLIGVAAPTRRSIAIHDDERDETSVFNEFGASPTGREWDAVLDATATATAQASCLVIAGSLPPGSPDDLVSQLVGLARTAGIPSIVDTSGAGLIAAAEAGASVVKPNRDELVAATGEADVHTAAMALLDAGARAVLLSLGPDGLVLLRGDAPSRSLWARLPQAIAGNATGAGDAAVAATAAALTGSDLVDTGHRLLRMATAWSAAAVLMPLAGEISPQHEVIAEQVVISDTPAALLSRWTGEER
ncbi:MAG: hexose kinase [Leifsonia sp.]